jgi:hypothetical protein
MQWPTISSGRFSHNEAYNRYVTDFESCVVVAIKSRILKWRDLIGKVKESRNRPGVAQRVSGGLGCVTGIFYELGSRDDK